MITLVWTNAQLTLEMQLTSAESLSRFASMWERLYAALGAPDSITVAAA